MISPKITDTDDFLELEPSAQSLYFHLTIHADDDGFIGNIKTIQRMCGSTNADTNALVDNQFLLTFEGSNVVVIKDWHIHNHIRKDRYSQTIYKEEASQLVVGESGAYEKVKTVDQEVDVQPDAEITQTNGIQDSQYPETDGLPNNENTSTNGLPNGNQLASDVEKDADQSNQTLPSAEKVQSKGIPSNGNQMATTGQPNGNQRVTQVRLGKVRLGKDRITSGSAEPDQSIAKQDNPAQKPNQSTVAATETLINQINKLSGSKYRVTDSWKRMVKARLEDYSLAELTQMVNFVWEDWANWEDRNKYFRPKTLFAPSNADEYIGKMNAAPTSGAKAPSANIASLKNKNWQAIEDAVEESDKRYINGPF